MSDTGFSSFRSAVFDDPDLQHKLREIDGHDEFIRLVLKIAEEKGFQVNTEDVETALRDGRRAWIERWI